MDTSPIRGGEDVRALRLAAGCSQAELARRMHVSRSRVEHVEASRVVTASTWSRVVDAIAVGGGRA